MKRQELLIIISIVCISITSYGQSETEANNQSLAPSSNRTLLASAKYNDVIQFGVKAQRWKENSTGFYAAITMGSLASLTSSVDFINSSTSNLTYIISAGSLLEVSPNWVSGLGIGYSQLEEFCIESSLSWTINKVAIDINYGTPLNNLFGYGAGYIGLGIGYTL